jgi:hypothetical protein
MPTGPAHVEHVTMPWNNDVANEVSEALRWDSMIESIDRRGRSTCVRRRRHRQSADGQMTERGREAPMVITPRAIVRLVKNTIAVVLRRRKR